MEVSYVLAGYNESELIEEAVSRCVKALEKDFDDYELILINDASKDNTLEIMNRCAQENPHIRVLDNLVNLNFGTSVLRGLKAAKKEWVVYNAVDLPLKPELTKKLIRHAQAYDVLVLERTAYGGVFWRKITSNMNILLLNILFPKLMKGTPIVNYVQIFRRSIIDRVMPLARSPIFVWPEMIFRAKLLGLRVGNIKNRPDISKVRKGAFGHPHDIIWGIYEMFRFKIRCMNNTVF